MLISKECDYAIRVVRCLADGEKRAAKAICDAESIPFQYTYKILKKLEKAGIAESFRGPSGGYRLIKDVGKLTVYDIMVSIDDEILLTECMKGGFHCDRNTGTSPCAVHREFHRLQQVLIQAMREKTLAQILG